MQSQVGSGCTSQQPMHGCDTIRLAVIIVSPAHNIMLAKLLWSFEMRMHFLYFNMPLLVCLLSPPSQRFVHPHRSQYATILAIDGNFILTNQTPKFGGLALRYLSEMHKGFMLGEI